MGKTGSPQTPNQPDKGRIFPTVQSTPKVVQGTNDTKRLFRQRQRQCIADLYSRANLKRRCRTGQQNRLSGVLQSPVSSPKTRKPLEASHRPQFLKSVPQNTKIQNGDPRIDSGLPQTRGMGNLDRLNRRLPSFAYTQTIQKVSAIPLQRKEFPVQIPSFRPSNSTPGVHIPGKGGETLGLKSKYEVTPIFGRLATQGPIQVGSTQSDRDTPTTGDKPGFHNKLQEVRTCPNTTVRLHRLPLPARYWSCETHSGQMVEDSRDISNNLKQICRQCKTSYVNHWIACISGENSTYGQDTHETFSVASQESLEIPDVSELTNSLDSDNDTTRGMVARPHKSNVRTITTSQGSRNTHLYRRLKRRLGRSYRQRFSKRTMVSSRTAPSYQPVRTKSSDSGSATLPPALQRETGSNCLRQHDSGVLYQQTGRDTFLSNVCTDVETSDLVQQTQHHTQVKACSRCLERYRGRPLTQGSNPGNRVVPVSKDIQTDLSTMGIPPDRSIRDQQKQQTTSVCVTHTGSQCFCSRCPQHNVGQDGRVRIPPNRPPAQDSAETSITVVQAHPSSPRLANETLVLGPGGDVHSNTPTTPTNQDLAQTTNEQPVPQPTGIPESPRVVSRSSTLRAQGFSQEVADRIAAPQRLSTRRIYANKWTVFERWCTDKQVDIRSPSIKDICDFLLHLFTQMNRLPSTIEGYRTAIADRLGSQGLNISNNPDIARLLASFHRDKPKCTRTLPKWNLSLVLQQLSKAAFEPLEECTIKHLTWKTVFLLALASGKRRSEIHSWTLEGLLSLEDWEKVQLSPSPSFLAKNQLARDGPAAIAPVVIPALAHAQGTLQTDILLCPVRALRAYLDRTAVVRTDQQLLFISFKRGFSKDIQCSTVSTWIKNTISFCYSNVEDADLDSLDIKAHDVRAFAASKAFYGGVSMDQIMSACHWKSHNTFTRFYLKDLSGQDQKDKHYHLGAFVAAQQVVPSQ